MIKQLASYARPLLQTSGVLQLRRNHALEHATIHLMSRRIRGLTMSGYSFNSGFILIGNAPTEQIEAATNDALKRMKGGERDLALHPNCGTNLVTAGVLTSLVALIFTRYGTRRMTLDRINGMMSMMMLAVLASQPLGMSLQRHFMTEGDPGDLEVVKVVRNQVNVPFLPSFTVHYIETHSSVGALTSKEA